MIPDRPITTTEAIAFIAAGIFASGVFVGVALIQLRVHAPSIAYPVTGLFCSAHLTYWLITCLIEHHKKARK